MSKQKCYKCDKIATWHLFSFSNYITENVNGVWVEKLRTDGFTGYACDAHVFRDCYCRTIKLIDNKEYLDLPKGVENKDWCWIIKGVQWEELDGSGFHKPCIGWEWDYEKEGFDND
jgi:hypothetical protein